MCGIIGIAGSQPSPPERLQAGLKALAHRGPDGSGQWQSPDRCVQLGHQRLAMVDIANGAQPLRTSDGSIVAVVNGEFYDQHNRLRKKLQAAGHRFSTNSDSELLIHLYAAEGIKGIQALQGEFAWVLWDHRQRCLYAARDRFGVKPLHFSRQANRLMLASEAKALLAMGIPARWQPHQLLHAFQHQYLPMGHSLFAGIDQLPPGMALSYQPETNHFASWRWWSLPHHHDTADSRQASQMDAQELRARLDQAVQSRLRGDTPVACALSGGIDSAAVAALASSKQARDCFTICFDSPPYAETDAARTIATHLQANWHPVHVDERSLVTAFPAAVVASECLAINGQLPAKHLLNQAVHAAGFKAILTGEGADECLLGYPHLRRDAGLGPSEQHDMAQGILLGQAKPQRLHKLKNKLGFIPHFVQAKASIGDRLQPFLTPAAQQELQHFDPLLLFYEQWAPEDDSAHHPVQRAADWWTRTSLADYILRALGDNAEMASGVEGRTPFLDEQVFSWARAHPVATRMPDGLEKPALRQAVADLLPAGVLGKAKQAFIAPPITRFQYPTTREWMLDTLTSQAAAALPWIDRQAMTSWIDTLSASDEHTQQLAEPAVLLVMSALCLQEHYGLSA